MTPELLRGEPRLCACRILALADTPARLPDVCFWHGRLCNASEKSPGPESRDGCVSRILSFRLQKSPTPDFEESAEFP